MAWESCWRYSTGLRSTGCDEEGLLSEEPAASCTARTTARDTWRCQGVPALQGDEIGGGPRARCPGDGKGGERRRAGHNAATAHLQQAPASLQLPAQPFVLRLQQGCVSTGFLIHHRLHNSAAPAAQEAAGARTRLLTGWCAWWPACMCVSCSDAAMAPLDHGLPVSTLTTRNSVLPALLWSKPAPCSPGVWHGWRNPGCWLFLTERWRMG